MRVRRGTAPPISDDSVLERRRSRESYAMRAPPAKAEPACPAPVPSLGEVVGGAGEGEGGEEGLGPSSSFGWVDWDEAGARRRDSPADDIHGETNGPPSLREKIFVSPQQGWRLGKLSSGSAGLALQYTFHHINLLVGNNSAISTFSLELEIAPAGVSLNRNP
ncbi:hypothetical protein B0H16DRAFT_1693935 [Mycena metata]|uniref:Uncharacterized protein n=1 Tax=Mycena metata TaxID=1033252 RepID=A0AAD7IGA0_9AGAR|nr:hypothetical protein B0H16DRAFT_1693935 [Mycena metata]